MPMFASDGQAELPLAHASYPFHYPPRLRRPRPRTLFLLLFICAIYAVVSQPNLRRSFTLDLRLTTTVPPPPPAPPPLPPLPLDEGMAAITHWEETLPQNVVTHSDLEGGERYLRYLNENWGVGFNNQLQEIIVHAHLAYLSNRSYVVPPLNFPGDNEWYPLSAFVRGTVVGSPAVSFVPPSHDPAMDPILSPHPPPRPLRAVSRAHFVRACPEWQSAPEANYTAIASAIDPSHVSLHPNHDADDNTNDKSRDDVNDTSRPPNQPSYLALSFAPLAAALGFEAGPPANVIMRGWAQVLRPGGGSAAHEGQRGTHREAPGDATCVTVHATSEHVFDYRLFGSLRILSLLPALLESPVLRDLHWSALVHGAVQRNLRAWEWVVGDTPLDEENGKGDTHTPLVRTLALHLRRGDYEAHCVNLRKWGAGFLGVNEAEGMGDRYTLPQGGASTPAEQATFAHHCWPTLEDIIQHVRRVRREWETRVRGGVDAGAHAKVAEQKHGAQDLNAEMGRGSDDWRLRRVYVSTNGDAAWWARVTGALRADGWEVRGSADMDFLRDDAVLDEDQEGDSGLEAEVEGATEGATEADWRARRRQRRRERRESERVVGLAVDMEVAARAEVFIGNGWSSFTSNVNLLRMAHGASRASIRFW